ncbi:MAG: GlsB/YeaQ/YmgE family stress response membrane protein [Propioniciclava sp.]|uniref:GlsB/YeaQ/YmgE family stress response membrane protein n=1 Tax=Propioniciclava sp. TaxID=2038686 RepID=UPI0039E3FA9B
MGIFGWIVLGLLAGSIAKAILPGAQGGGWLATLVLGVVGALVGGFLGSVIFHVGLGDFFSLRTWVLSILGSVLVLAVWGRMNNKRV